MELAVIIIGLIYELDIFIAANIHDSEQMEPLLNKKEDAYQPPYADTVPAAAKLLNKPALKKRSAAIFMKRAIRIIP